MRCVASYHRILYILECVVEVSDYLKSRYMRTRFTSEGEEWPPDQPKHFTSLSLIHHKDGRTQREVIAIAEATRSGNIDAILSEQKGFLKESCMFFSQNKTSKDIKEIFAPSEDGQEPHSILIEGAPGIGKTFLSKEISVQWANGQLLVNAILVFLIFLRDPLVKKINSLKDLVKYYYRFDESSDTIASSCAEYLINSKGNCVTFVFDGFDEYPENLQNSFIFDMLQYNILSKRRLVLTSRPHMSARHQWFGRRVEILGFTKEDRQNYINSALKDKAEDIAPLIDYLDSHVTISSLCFIPFNMTMLLWLYKQGVVLPSSSTELYNYFICHTIRHHLAKIDVIINNNILSLNDLEDPYKNVIQQLSRLSYKALSNNQLTFSLDKVKSVCPQIDKIPGALNCFGLLQAVRYPGIMGMATILSFIHFSVQEFLAAYHVTCLPDDEALFELKEKFMSEVHAHMFTVYVGMTKGKQKAFKEYLKYGTSIAVTPCTTEHVFIKLCVDSEEISINTEILKNMQMCLRLFKCFHEAGDKDACSKLIDAGCFSYESDHIYLELLSPIDAECLGLILTSKQEWMTLGLFLSDSTFEILYRILTTNRPTIHEIVLDKNFSGKSLSDVVDIVLMCNTTYLGIHSITPEFISLKTQLRSLMIMSKEQDQNVLANFLHENDILVILIICMYRPEDLSEQLLQTVANSLKHNNTLQAILIGGPAFQVRSFMISQRVQVVKWKVKTTRIIDEMMYIAIDFE